MRTKFIIVIGFITVLTLKTAAAYQAPYAEQAPTVDGLADELVWSKAKWQSVDKLTLGSMPTTEDFSARFKVAWTEQKLYLMAEIIDDVLIDTHADPLDSYWEDDTFEIFVDEDKSGGDHLNNYNAFAYHIALDNQAVDINTNGQPQTFNDHIESVWKRSQSQPNKVIWEVSIEIYPDTYQDTQNSDETSVQAVTLAQGKEMGLLVAYCDSDSLSGRKHFLGSVDVPAINGDKNRAYIDASVFGDLVLIK